MTEQCQQPQAHPARCGCEQAREADWRNALRTANEHTRQLMTERDALLSSAEPVKPEFCCEHAFKAAKQAVWDARRMDRCKCDHTEYCEHCWPSDFREGGKWHGKFEPAKGGDGEAS